MTSLCYPFKAIPYIHPLQISTFSIYLQYCVSLFVLCSQQRLPVSSEFVFYFILSPFYMTVIENLDFNSVKGENVSVGKRERMKVEISEREEQ